MTLTRPLGALVAGAALLLLLSGCMQAEAVQPPAKGSGMNSASDEALYAEGRAHFRAFTEEVGTVQQRISAAEWTVENYGAAPRAQRCTDGKNGYDFVLDRSITGLGIDLDAQPQQLADALDEAGWGTAGISAEESTDPGARVSVVRAERSPEGAVQRLFVSFYEATDTVLLKAESSCAAGDQERLFDLVFPDESSFVVPITPETEAPGADPIFRFSIEDGTARDEREG